MEASKQGSSNSVRKFSNIFDNNSVLVLMFLILALVFTGLFAAFNVNVSIRPAKTSRAIGAFDFAVATGDLVESCKQAGLIAEDYHNARDLDGYKKWVTIRDDECGKAQGRK